MARTFSAWKAQTAVRLFELRRRREDDPKIARAVDALLARLRYLKARDLAASLALVHGVSRDAGAEELLPIAPSEEGVARWFEEGRRGDEGEGGAVRIFMSDPAAPEFLPLRRGDSNWRRAP